MISELFWPCGIFLHFFFTWFRNCSDNVVFFYMISELLWQCCIFLHVFLNDFGTVPTVWYFSTWLRNCSDSVVLFYRISELFWQCSISYMISELFWECCIFLHDFGAALTVLYFSTWFRNCSDSVVFPTWFLSCSNSVVCFYNISKLLWQCGIFLYVFLNDFWTVLTVGYFCTWFRNCSDIVVFSVCFFTWFRNCSDSVVFFYIISELLWQCGIFLHVFLHDFGTVLTV
jgi:hypothetical protein